MLTIHKMSCCCRIADLRSQSYIFDTGSQAALFIMATRYRYFWLPPIVRHEHFGYIMRRKSGGIVQKGICIINPPNLIWKSMFSTNLAPLQPLAQVRQCNHITTHDNPLTRQWERSYTLNKYNVSYTERSRECYPRIHPIGIHKTYTRWDTPPLASVQNAFRLLTIFFTIFGIPCPYILAAPYHWEKSCP